MTRLSNSRCPRAIDDPPELLPQHHFSRRRRPVAEVPRKARTSSNHRSAGGSFHHFLQADVQPPVFLRRKASWSGGRRMRGSAQQGIQGHRDRPSGASGARSAALAWCVDQGQVSPSTARTRVSRPWSLSHRTIWAPARSAWHDHRAMWFSRAGGTGGDGVAHAVAVQFQRNGVPPEVRNIAIGVPHRHLLFRPDGKLCRDAKAQSCGSIARRSGREGGNCRAPC